RQQRGDRPEGGGLAGAVRPQQPEDFPFPDRQIDPVDRYGAPERNPQLAAGQRESAGHGSTVTRSDRRRGRLEKPERPTTRLVGRKFEVVRRQGLEPRTRWLRASCSAN